MHLGANFNLICLLKALKTYFSQSASYTNTVLFLSQEIFVSLFLLFSLI